MENETGASQSRPGDSGASKGPTSLLDLINSAGWGKWVLGAFSFAVVAIAIFCAIDLQRGNFHPKVFSEQLQPDLESLNLEGVVQKARGAKNCLATVMLSAVAYINDKGYEVLDSERLDEVMGTASRKFNRGRARTIGYFSILAQAGPMMGLLGTVTGMIGAFGTLNQSGGGDPSAFAGDISMALVTTAWGLIIALPAIFFYFFFRNRLQDLVSDCDDEASLLIGRLRHALAQFQQTEGQD